MPHDGGNAAEEQHDHARRPGWLSQQIEHDANEAVDRDLGHDTAHQRGHVARRGGMGERQPDMQRHQAGLGAGAEQHQNQHQCRRIGRMLRGANGCKSVVSRRSRQQAEREQQRERAEACHHQIDVTGPGVAPFAMMRHDKRPRRQRHELPAQQIGEGVVRQHHEVHAGEKGGEKRKHAVRRGVMMAVAEAIETCRHPTQIDDHEEERGQCVEAEVRAKPRQTDGQDQRAAIGRAAEQEAQRADQCNRRYGQCCAIDDGCGDLRPAQNDRQRGQPEQSGDTDHLQGDGRHYLRALAPLNVLFSARSPEPAMSRTPRPPPSLFAPSSINSMPASSSAVISFTSKSTLPRTIVSLASIR